jgi:polyhydroxyalkanoate synthesis regulator phasin
LSADLGANVDAALNGAQRIEEGGVMGRVKARQRRIRELHRQVRPFVEKHCGPGSLPEKKFAKLYQEGIAFVQREKAKRKKQRDALLQRLDRLEREVKRLQAQGKSV